jgi:hypothetical protein
MEQVELTRWPMHLDEHWNLERRQSTVDHRQSLKTKIQTMESGPTKKFLFCETFGNNQKIISAAVCITHQLVLNLFSSKKIH